MATPKKGQGITFKLPGQPEVAASQSLELELTVGRETAPAAVAMAPRAMPKTGLGLLSRVIADAHGDSEEVARLNEQISELKLRVGEQLLDPRQIRLSRWAD